MKKIVLFVGILIYFSIIVFPSDNVEDSSSDKNYYAAESVDKTSNRSNRVENKIHVITTDRPALLFISSWKETNSMKSYLQVKRN